jgi:alcohol dehydrogenase class IV
MEQQMHQIFSPNRILFGIGASKEIGRQAKALGGSKALLVTDPGIVSSGLVEPIARNLEAAGVKAHLYGRVEPEPPAYAVDEGVIFAREAAVDIVIGLGGGSSLDVAKGISLLMCNPGRVLDYCGIEQVPKRGLPKILVPTTAGTGSEVTRSIILIDPERNTKSAITSSYALSDLAVVDPLLTLSMPAKVTADSGMDALVHAIEAYVSLTATPFSDLLATEAITSIHQYLPAAYAKGENLDARYHMALGSLFAGLAVASGGLAAVHGLAYPLATEYHLSHGRANAVMLSHVMAFNLIGSHARYAAIAEMMGEGKGGTESRAKAAKAIEAVKGLLDDLSISCRLRDYGIPEEAIPRLVAGGIKQARLFGRNPRNLAEKDIEAIYTKAW